MVSRLHFINVSSAATGTAVAAMLLVIDDAFSGWTKADKRHFADGGSVERIRLGKVARYRQNLDWRAGLGAWLSFAVKYRSSPISTGASSYVIGST